ncbi:MAG: putative zinc metalloprotease [Chlamydiae bacterium]|nr:putative zinc metalloprotease [Chlamydiota bacterium]
MASLLYAALALFGIGFLIFIHELGHYFMARRVGITVEVFAIGFGRAILEWEHKGVKWKLGWLPFGGYVKMAGTEKKGSIEPYQVADGFFGKKPWDRIKVAMMGPLVNIAFALFAFTLLWTLGGRDKPFSDFTNTIGWVEKDSGLYRTAIRPGDQVTTLNGKPFTRFENLLYAAVLENHAPEIGGEKINYFTGEKEPFHYSFDINRKLDGAERAMQALSNFGPAGYLIYDRAPDGREVPLPKHSPLRDSGIAYGDRILWADGALIFSQRQLVRVLNEAMVLLTVEREGKTFLTRVPRLQVGDLQLTALEKDEIDDWRFGAGLDARLDQLAFIPYNLNGRAVVEKASRYVDQQAEVQSSYVAGERAGIASPLMPGDRILAVHGTPVSSGNEFLKAMQEKKVLLVAQKMSERKIPLWTEADKAFASSFEIGDLKKIISQIGVVQGGKGEVKAGDLRLLNPIAPIAMQDFPLSPEKEVERQEYLASRKKAIDKISDPQVKKQAQKELERYKKRLMIGVPLQDQLVSFNPAPLLLFGNVFQETYRTLFALLSGTLSPKNIMGPVGIVQVIHHSWTIGAKEALFWLGMISLNLGMLNLLPIPVLDGGHIVFAIVEKFTKKPLKAKTMERLIIPFVVMLVALFVYLTYHDISRLVTKLF